MYRLALFSAATLLSGVAFAGPDFSALLSKPTDEIKKPKPLPEGTYTLLCTKFEYREAKTPNDKENPVKATCQLSLRYQEAMSDVDSADLDEALQGEALTTKATNYDLWLTPDAQYRVVELCKTAGIDTEGKTLGEIIPELVNKTFTGTASKVQSKKPGQEGTFYTNITALIGTDAPDALAA